MRVQGELVSGMEGLQSPVGVLAADTVSQARPLTHVAVPPGQGDSVELSGIHGPSIRHLGQEQGGRTSLWHSP